MLINVTGSIDIGLEEVEQAASLVQAAVHPDALTIFGATFDETLDDEIRVTVIATGFDKGPGELPRKMSDGTREAAPAQGDAAIRYQPVGPPDGGRTRFVRMEREGLALRLYYRQTAQTVPPEKPELKGAVTIEGKARYGETLTVDVSKSNPLVPR